jgi:hypothetical protein
MPLKKIKEKFKSWLEMEDDRVIDVVLGTVVANRFHGDSVNIHIVGPPSSSKTELLRATFDLPDVYPLSTLTAHTFTSGLTYRGEKLKDYSLLAKLSKAHKILLVIKDFTTILEKRNEDRAEIFSQIREIADGHFTHDYGSGKEATVWKGRLGILTGVTTVIDKQYSLRQILGERFLHYRLPWVDPYEMAKRAGKNTGKEERMRRELSSVVTDFMKGFSSPKLFDVKSGGVTEDMLINLAMVVAEARTGTSRDRYTQGLAYIPEPEAPPRLMKYFSKLGRAIALIQGKSRMDMEVYKILAKVARDTLPSYRNSILKTLWHQYPNWNTLPSLSGITTHSLATLRLNLEDLVALKLVTAKVSEESGVGRPENQYRLSDKLHEYLRMCQIYEPSYS